tara:strand:- start:6484 stop:6726 length:243 start_codon:yes stop_codon:yes gene_type:complete
MSWKSQSIDMVDGVRENMHAPGSWWCSEDDEVLIQVVYSDNFMIDTIQPINFKYWTGPKTNHFDGSTIEEFYSTWKFKSK